MSDEAQERLTMLALGIRGDHPVDPEQPQLLDAIHLRWAPAQELGFPWFGFYLFRRESRPARPLCLSSELGSIRPGPSHSVKLATKLGTLSSPQPLLFTDDFAPAGTVEVDLRAPLRFDLPEGVEARSATVSIGFRGGEVTRTCVDFRPFPVGSGPNPRTEQGAVFSVEAVLTPPSATASIEQLSGGPRGLEGASRFESSVRITIALPCPATRVDLLVTNPANVRIEGFDSAGASVGAQSFAPLALQAGAVRLSGKAMTRITLESAGVESALLHEICWECPKPPQPGKTITVNFEDWPVGQRPNPVVEQGVSFQVILFEPTTARLVPAPHASFEKRLQVWTGLRGPRIDIQLPCPTTKVRMQFSRGSNDPAVHLQAFNEDGTVAQSLDLHVGNFGTEDPLLEGAAITRIQVDMPGPDALFHLLYFDCAAATPGPTEIAVRGIGQDNLVVSQVLVTGDPGQIVAGSLIAGSPYTDSIVGITAIEISAGNAALVDICYVPSRQSDTFGWQEVPKFQYPLCLPVADAGYPCAGKPTTSADAQTLAFSRVTYRAPTGWDQGFSDLHAELVTLVHGGPGGGPMSGRVHPDLQGQPLSPVTEDVPTLPGLKPLDLVFLASLHPAFAQMLGLYFADDSAQPDVAYDYLLLGDTTGALGGSAASALDWLAFTGNAEEVWKELLLDESTKPRAPIAPPGAPRAYALPGMATRAIDGTLPAEAAGSVGLWWPLPPDLTDQQPQPDQIVFYKPRRVFLGSTRPPAEPDPSQYTTRLPPVLISEPDPQVPPVSPNPRSSDWPPPATPIHIVDSNLPEGWYSYRVAGQDIFGRFSAPGPPAEWYQWVPPSGTPAPWYYKPDVGEGSIDPFAVALLDKMPPPTPLGVEAWALDPLDRWVIADAPYQTWRSASPDLVGLRVRFRWTLMQQIQAPDTNQFRLYFQPGRWNALMGRVDTVTAASAVQSDVDLDFADPLNADTFAGTRLRVGNDDFAVAGSQPGTKLRLRVNNIGANNEIGPTVGKPCTIAIPEGHALWVDTGVATTWAMRLAVVPYDPPARIVVDPSKDANGLPLSDKAFTDAHLAAQITINGTTAQLPLQADLSGIQPWIDHLWLQDATGAEQRIRILRFNVTSCTVTLETPPTVGAPVSWIVGRPAREYDVFLPAPDVGAGQPFEPTLADPSVYAQVAVSAADNRTHVADTFPGGTLVGNESRLSPSATVFRVLQKAPDAPGLPQLPERLVATPADYHSRSYTTFRFTAVPLLKIHILRAMDDTLFQCDWLIRETRKALDPAKHPDYFPSDLVGDPLTAAATLKAITAELDYDALSDDAWRVLARLPGNEGAAGNKPIPQNTDLKARDWLVRRTHTTLTIADTNLFPTYWNPATQLAALGAVNIISAPTDYATLPDNALRLLAALPGHESAFARITIHPFDMADPEIQDQRRPDDDALYTPKPNLRAYLDTLPGRATNRYFYRASFVDGAQNQSALSIPGPPVYLPDTTSPAPPVINSVTGGDQQVILRWTSSAGSSVERSVVYRTTDKEMTRDVRLLGAPRASLPARVLVARGGAVDLGTGTDVILVERVYDASQLAEGDDPFIGASASQYIAAPVTPVGTVVSGLAAPEDAQIVAVYRDSHQLLQRTPAPDVPDHWCDAVAAGVSHYYALASIKVAEIDDQVSGIPSALSKVVVAMSYDVSPPAPALWVRSELVKVDNGGAEHPFSDTVTVFTLAVRLVWTGDSNSESMLERKADSALTWESLTPWGSASGSQRDDAIEAGRTYQYRIRSRKGNGGTATSTVSPTLGV